MTDKITLELTLDELATGVREPKTRQSELSEAKVEVEA